jgi:hypothetical protein
MAIATGQVLMLHGRWRESIERSDAGARQLAETCRGVAFLCNIGRGIPVRAVEELGDLVALGIRARELQQAGAVLGDRFAETIGSQHLSTVLLARDDPTAARDHERHVAQRWPRDSFLLQHLYALRQAAMCDLYQGRAEGSYQRLLAAWPKARRAQLLRVSLARIDALSIRGRLALALACRDGAAGSLAGVARKDAAALLRERRDDATVHARLLQAGLATLDGDPPGAVRALDAARTAAERAAMSLHAAVAAYRRASLHGDRGTEGRSERDAAAAQMSAFGVHDADRWAALYAPGRFG